jgi:hypothetical protein
VKHFPPCQGEVDSLFLKEFTAQNPQFRKLDLKTMAQQLKRWESPRNPGRNQKGRGGSARQRQLKKQHKRFLKQLKAEAQANAIQTQATQTQADRLNQSPSLPDGNGLGSGFNSTRIPSTRTQSSPSYLGPNHKKTGRDSTLFPFFVFDLFAPIQFAIAPARLAI